MSQPYKGLNPLALFQKHTRHVKTINRLKEGSKDSLKVVTNSLTYQKEHNTPKSAI